MRDADHRTLFGAALLCLAALAVAVPAGAQQDVLTIGSTSAERGGTANVPLYVRDVANTALDADDPGNRIQGFGFRVTCSPASAVASITFTRAGVLQALTPLYERSVSPAAGVAWVASFAESTNPIPFVLGAAAPGNQIGTLTIQLTTAAVPQTSISLIVTAATAVLSNHTGTGAELVALSNLAVVDGSIAVTAASTTTSSSSSANPSITGESVTFTASVTSAVAGAKTGTVTFRDGATPLGTVALSSSQATFTTAALAQGTHSITAEYSGDTHYLGSTSSALSQVVHAAPFGPPPGLVATATSTTAVNVSWLSVASASHYQVWRSANNPAYTLAGVVPGTSFDDTVNAGVTYLYKVRAVNASSVESAFSSIDAATTIVFADDPLAAGVTPAKLVHLTQLRAAVNAFRAVAGLPAAAFTDPSPTTATVIRQLHIAELRTALGAARTSLGMPAVAYTDPPLPPQVKAVHVQEIRSAVK